MSAVAAVGDHVAPSSLLAAGPGDDRRRGLPRLVLAHVREQLPAVDVADAVEPGQALDLQRVVDVEVLPRLQADGVEADVAGARGPADRRPAPRRRGPRRRPCVSTTSVALAAGGGDVDAEPDVDAGVAQRRGDRLAGRGLGPRQQPVAALQERDLRAERLPGGRHLAADDAAAEDQQPAGRLLRAGGLARRPRLRPRPARRPAAACRPSRCRRRPRAARSAGSRCRRRR